MEQDLKPEGVALFWSKYYDRWLDSIDRGTAPEKRRL
jgi:hypothetical protein